MTTGIDAASPQPRPALAAPGRTPSGGQPRQDAGYPEGLSPQGAALKASAAKAHSRAWQDAKRRENKDAERLT